MTDVKNHINLQVRKVIKNLYDIDLPIELEYPVNESFGDYSTSIAMKMVKNLKAEHKKSPRELASEIASGYEKLGDETVKKVESVGPGFVNFFLSEKFLISKLNDVLAREKSSDWIAGKAQMNVIIEFTDPNPFKEFHVGHLYSNTVGESLARLEESQGATVKRANYYGDVGMHVAKSLYGILLKFKVQSSKFKVEQQLEELEKLSLRERVKFLGEAYALGSEKFETDGKAAEEIKNINKKVYAKDPEVLDLYETGKKWSLEYFETIYKRLGTEFDFYYPESEVGVFGATLVKEYLQKGVFEESEGAVIFPGKKHGLHNRVFINSLGLPTYEAKELGLAPKKYEDFSYDRSIIITGNEIDEYFKVLLKALSFIRPDLSEKTIHLSHGMVRLKEGKMSSRTGNVLTGEWLLDEAKTRIKTAYPDMDDSVSEMVAVAAVKYAMLKSSIGKDIIFSFEESISLSGNSGPYIQYTYARTQSILSKVTINNLQFTIETNNLEMLEPEEADVLRYIYRYFDIVIEAASSYSPNTLATYLYELAQKFNFFYQKHKVIGSENEQFRLSLTKATGNVIKNGLYLLGIQAPRQM